MAQCNAVSKHSGQQCKAHAITGSTKCRIHGGMTPKGIASPNFRHGRYSKSLPDRLVSRYQDSLSDPELLNLTDEIALVDSRLAELVNRQDSKASAKVWNELVEGYNNLAYAFDRNDTKRMKTILIDIGKVVLQAEYDYRNWDEIRALIDQRRQLVESRRKHLIEMQQMLKVEDAMTLVAALLSSIKEHIKDKNALNAISADIRRLISV